MRIWHYPLTFMFRGRKELDLWTTAEHYIAYIYIHYYIYIYISAVSILHIFRDIDQNTIKSIQIYSRIITT